MGLVNLSGLGLHSRIISCLHYDWISKNERGEFEFCVFLHLSVKVRVVLTKAILRIKTDANMK